MTCKHTGAASPVNLAALTPCKINIYVLNSLKIIFQLR